MAPLTFFIKIVNSSLRVWMFFSHIFEPCSQLKIVLGCKVIYTIFLLILLWLELMYCLMDVIQLGIFRAGSSHARSLGLVFVTMQMMLRARGEETTHRGSSSATEVQACVLPFACPESINCHHPVVSCQRRKVGINSGAELASSFIQVGFCLSTFMHSVFPSM